VTSNRGWAAYFAAMGAGLGVAGASAPALAHENQVIIFGPFLGGFTHPVLGLDHFLAMVSVGIVSAIIGGRAIWTVPATFVTFMALGGVLGWSGLAIPMSIVETGIGISVVLLGVLIVLDRALPTLAVQVPVAFFGTMHGVAHGAEIPSIADPVLYAAGFMSGTIAIHVLGVLIGDISRRYRYGRIALRVAGAASAVAGALFLAGVL
jgi:urease accessory protein